MSLWNQIKVQEQTNWKTSQKSENILQIIKSLNISMMALLAILNTQNR